MEKIKTVHNTRYEIIFECEFYCIVKFEGDEETSVVPKWMSERCPSDHRYFRVFQKG